MRQGCRFPLPTGFPKMQVACFLRRPPQPLSQPNRKSLPMALLEASVSIRCPVERVFDFLTLAENFTKIVPPDLQLRVVQSPERLALGSRFEVQILGFGVPQNVIYEITEFVQPQRFQESQIKGPLGRYVHEHAFASQDDGTVRVTDRIEFEPPGGLLGFLLTADRLKSSLEQGLTHRHRELKRLLEDS
jgi:ligand-binding SRPBCC domain-containing protein